MHITAELEAYWYTCLFILFIFGLLSLLGSYDLCGIAGTAVASTWLKVKCTTPTVARYVIVQVVYYPTFSPFNVL